MSDCWCKGECPVVRPILDQQKNFGPRRSERALRLALLDAPNCVEANLMFAGILNMTNRADAGAVHIARAFSDKNHTVKANIYRGDNSRSGAQPIEAAVFYRAALEADPSKVPAHVGLIFTLQHAGQVDAAEAAAIAAMKACPGELEIIRAGASVEAEKKNFAAAAAMLAPDQRPIALLDRGRYLDRAGDFDAAWACFMAAKHRSRRQGFNRQGFDRMVGGLMDLATKRKQDAMGGFFVPPKTDKGPRPLFIMGFPRSGTTMFETALAAHSKIAGADELPFVFELTRVLAGLAHAPAPYPEAMMSFAYGENLTLPATLRDIYLRKASSRFSGFAKGTKWFTDKMPLNEMHLPLMLRLFPESPRFYMRRHPLDIILSNMSYGISHGFNYAASPESAAYAYSAIDALLLKYRQLWPGAVIEVKYENFVADHRQVIDNALAAAGVEPEPGCYDFHLSGRHSRTISNRQIKEPLYDRSVGRYKHYMKHLEPIFDAVRPIAEREGYSI